MLGRIIIIIVNDNMMLERKNANTQLSRVLTIDNKTVLIAALNYCMVINLNTSLYKTKIHSLKEYLSICVIDTTWVMLVVQAY